MAFTNPLSTLKTWWRNRQRSKVVRDFGAMIASYDPGRIYDGVDYSLPINLPSWLRQELSQQNKLDAFIAESYRTATQMQFDSPYKTDDPINPVTEDPLREWNQQTRMVVLTNCHAAYQRNPIGKRAVDYIANFVVGDGFRLNVHNQEVKKVLEAFIEHPENNIRRYEREALRGLIVDGEIILRYFQDNQSGETICVPMRPWELQYIETELGFFKRVIQYHFILDKSKGDFPAGNEPETLKIPADEIHFVPINKLPYELRGRPELYSALPYLKAYKDWLENRARLNYWKSVIMWLVSVEATSPNAVSAIKQQFTKPPTPGSIGVFSSAVSVQAINATIGADDAKEDGRALKLMPAIAIGGLPEYMLSDGENANLATANKQELPVLTTFGEFQRIMKDEVLTPIFRRVLQNAIDANVLPETVPVQDSKGKPIEEIDPEKVKQDSMKNMKQARDVMKQDMQAPVAEADPYALGDDAEEEKEETAETEGKTIETLKAFEIEYEPLAESSELEMAQVVEKWLANNLISIEGAQIKVGIDPVEEQERLLKEKAKEAEEIAQGTRAMPPEMRPMSMPNGKPQPFGNKAA